MMQSEDRLTTVTRYGTCPILILLRSGALLGALLLLYHRRHLSLVTYATFY